MSHARIGFDEILQLANDDRMSHVARMVAIRKICVREIDRDETQSQKTAAEKRGPGRPRKDDGAKAGDAVQDSDTTPTGPASA
jgi:hypothetical protein